MTKAQINKGRCTHPLRVAIISDLLILQRIGGIQRQILETIEGLKRAGHNADFFDPVSGSLEAVDVAHVFDAEGGNNRLVQTLKDRGLPVVLSPVISPRWTKWSGWWAKLCDRAVRELTGSKVRTTYRQIVNALDQADRLIALSNLERKTITDAFCIPATKIDVIPNGVSKAFFDAEPTIFREKFGISGNFVLTVGSINPQKNQLSLARCLAGCKVPLVLIGPCAEGNRAYLEAITAHRNVHYLGSMGYNDPELPSAYAAAGVFALPSLWEVTPISVYEALAAGTAVVVTKHHAMNLPKRPGDLLEVDPQKPHQIRRAILELLAAPRRSERRKALVAEYDWDKVAQQILSVYEKALSAPNSAPPPSTPSTRSHGR